MAFNAKNLSYDRQEPAFLRKLRGASGGVDPVRHERPMQRPRKPRNKDDEDEDAPTYIDEETNETLTKEEYEALIGGGKDTLKPPNTHGDSDTKPEDSEEPTKKEQTSTTEAPKAQEKIVEIGGQKRKKQARVVGGDDKDSPAEDDASRKDSSSSRKPRGKKKKVKLSFDDA